MNDRELDRLLLAAARDVPDLRAGRQALLEEIMSAPALDPDPTDDALDLGPTEPLPVRRAPSRARRVAIALAAAAALVAAVAVPAAVFRRGAEVPVVPAATGAGSHLVVDLPGWQVGNMSQSSAADKDATYSDGTRDEVNVTWYPASGHDQFVQDRKKDGPGKAFRLLGQTGLLFTYRDGEDYEVLLPPRGRSFVGIRSRVTSLEDFRRIMGHLRYVDAAAWAAYVPADFVTPGREKAAAEAMLADVPRPPSFSAKDLRQGYDRSYYQFGAHVMGQVACGWIASWVQARADHDRKATSRAKQALAGSRQWPTLVKMQAQGGFPEVVWQYADAVAQGTDTPGGKAGLTVAGTYHDALGCDTP